MPCRCGSIEDMSENHSMHVQYSVFTLQQANWGDSQSGWVGGEVGVHYSTPLNCAVFVFEDVQVFHLILSIDRTALRNEVLHSGEISHKSCI